MSSLELYVFPERGEGSFYCSLSNSARYSLLIWDTLCKKYLGQGLHVYMTNEENFHYIWDLALNKNLSKAERLIFLSTMDYALLRKSEIDSFISLTTEYCNLYKGREGILLDHVKVLENIKRMPNVYAVGWNMTSIVNTNWVLSENEDKNSYYDLSKDDKHWFIFDA